MTTPTDPKGASGKTKPQMHLIPSIALEHMAAALANGAERYGQQNWRTPGTKLLQSTYLSAMMRHICAILDGEDTAPDSGVSHLGHILANAAIMLDAARAGTLHDDRVPVPSGLQHALAVIGAEVDAGKLGGGEELAEPEWHNPEDLELTDEEKAAGWRFLIQGEITAEGDQVYAGDGIWMESNAKFYRGWTYRTKRPLPK